MKYYERYLEKMRVFLGRGPMAAEKLAMLDALERHPIDVRFRMAQDVERVIQKLEPEGIDWERGVALVRELAAEVDDPEEFRRRLYAAAGL